MAIVRRLNVAPPVSHLFERLTPSPLGSITLGGLHVDPTFKPEPMAMRYWNVYSAVYVLSGRAVFEDMTGRRQDVEAGDLMLMFPRHGYAYQTSTTPPWGEIFIQFRGPTFDLWRENKVIHPSRPVLKLPASADWLRRLEAVIEPSHLPEPCQTLKRLLRLQDVLVDALLAAASMRKPHARADWLDIATAKIDLQPLDTLIDWDKLSEQMSLSHDRFRKRFKSLAGVSPSQYRASRVMNSACEMLHDLKLPLKEIARRCGFSDVFHFSKRFAQVVGIPPSRYRKHLTSGFTNSASIDDDRS